MIKDIKFNGCAATPADNISLEGDLEISMNLINEDSSLRPLTQPHEVGVIPAGWNARYVHYNSTYRHIIVYNDSTKQLGWLDFPIGVDTVAYSSDSVTVLPMPSDYTGAVINSLVGVGNTLVVLTDKGLLYYLWKSDSIGYIQLGDHLPECKLSLSLQLDSSHLGLYTNQSINNVLQHPTHVQQVNTLQLAHDDYAGHLTLDDTKNEENSNAVLGSVNQVMEECKKKGFFLNNFFVRYAFRLYDGSLTMHSAPVLMVCSSDRINPIVKTIDARSHDNWNSAEIEIFAPKFSLYCSSLMDSGELNKWSDIIKSVDIFITPEIENYNVSGKLESGMGSFGNVVLCDKYEGSLFDNSGYGLQTYCINTKKTLYRDLLKTAWPGKDSLRVVELPAFNDDYIKEHISSNADFHLLYSCDIEKLSTINKVPIENEYLVSLRERESMSDDNFSHDKLFAKSAFAYNSRINIANIARLPFDGYDLSTIAPYCSGSDNKRYTLHFYIRENGMEMVVSKSIEQGKLQFLSPFIFYPNPNVYKCIIEIASTNANAKYYELPMKPHDFLNGSYYFDGFYHGGVYNKLLSAVLTDEPPVLFPEFCTEVNSGPTEAELNADKYIEYPNKIYTADANNPFVFSAENVNSIGASEILALASITKALSAGQFGQFPLYAFTSEGVWALESSSTGSIASMHPVTRDVCTNVDSITQIDDAVLFVTARGIMLLSGSNVTCISDVINTNAPFDCTSLPSISKLPTHFVALMEKPKSFLSYLANCKLLYDYTHQHIIAYPIAQKSTESNMSFVFSMRSKLWGMVKTNIKLSLNCYPDAIVVDAGNKILNYSYEKDGLSNSISPQIFVTRPLQLELPNILKTIDTIIMRGEFVKGNVQIVLYGSRDLVNWHIVWSSKDHYLRGFRGTPYKYFRIVSPCLLSNWESVTGATVQFNPRYTNQPR